MSSLLAILIVESINGGRINLVFQSKISVLTLFKNTAPPYLKDYLYFVLSQIVFQIFQKVLAVSLRNYFFDRKTNLCQQRFYGLFEEPKLYLKLNGAFLWFSFP